MAEPQSYRLDKTIADAVERDGLPRQAIDQLGSGTIHVLYLENGSPLAHSMLAADWLAQRGALPADPTQAEVDAAIAARAAAAVQAQADATALRQQVLGIAQGTVGMRIDATFTAAQLKALLAILLWKAGALDRTGAIRPLADWIDRR
jgi:hypothetical protein